MKKRIYNTPKARITRMCALHQMLLSSGVEVGITHGAKENSFMEEIESDDEE